MSSFLNPGDKQRLEEIIESAESEIDRRRAEILLAFEAGMSMREVSAKVDVPVQRVLYWRREYLKRGLGLFE
jgi:transposase